MIGKPVGVAAASRTRCYDENRARRVPHDLLGPTAEQHPLNSTATMAAYHKDVGRPAWQSPRCAWPDARIPHSMLGWLILSGTGRSVFVRCSMGHRVSCRELDS